MRLRVGSLAGQDFSSWGAAPGFLERATLHEGGELGSLVVTQAPSAASLAGRVQARRPESGRFSDGATYHIQLPCQLCWALVSIASWRVLSLGQCDLPMPALPPAGARARKAWA